MRYSLLNRFRGALLGSFVGNTLGSGDGKGEFLEESRLSLPQSRQTHPSATSNWSQIARCGAESLIRCGKLDVEDWLRRAESTQPSLLYLQSTASTSEAVVATLPVALFCHEDEVKWRPQLLQAARVWLHEQTSEEVLIVAYAIALALTEKLTPALLIPQILNDLNPSPTPLVQQLELVQTLVQKGAGLNTALTQLRHQARQDKGSHSCLAIALAFYCFLYTPEDFRLCMTRSLRTGYQPHIATLTGTLAGVYNSILGIPVGWHLVTQQIPSGIQWMQLADQLFAVWSGIYDISMTEQAPTVAIAAPRVIQPR